MDLRILRSINLCTDCELASSSGGRRLDQSRLVAKDRLTLPCPMGLTRWLPLRRGGEIRQVGQPLLHHGFTGNWSVFPVPTTNIPYFSFVLGTGELFSSRRISHPVFIDRSATDQSFGRKTRNPYEALQSAHRRGSSHGSCARFRPRLSPPPNSSRSGSAINTDTRGRAYDRIVSRFLVWCQDRNLDLRHTATTLAGNANIAPFGFSRVCRMSRLMPAYDFRRRFTERLSHSHGKHAFPVNLKLLSIPIRDAGN